MWMINDVHKSNFLSLIRIVSSVNEMLILLPVTVLAEPLVESGRGFRGASNGRGFSGARDG